MTERAVVPLTGKQQMVLDYMRGNGCVLTTDGGWLHLVRRGSFTNRGLSQVLGALEDKGMLDRAEPPAPSPRYSLTSAGRRA